MAGFGNKKAAPFVNGGGRKKNHPTDARGKAKKALSRAKMRQNTDMANALFNGDVDLAFRFKHGWIRIDGGAKDPNDYMGSNERAENKAVSKGKAYNAKQAWKKENPGAWPGDYSLPKIEQAIKANSAANKADGEAKYKAKVAEEARKEKERAAKKMLRKAARAQVGPRSSMGGNTAAERRLLRKEAHSLSTPSTGKEIDLDWSAFNAKKGNKPKAKVFAAGSKTGTALKNQSKALNHGVSKKLVSGFKKSAGVKGAGLGPQAQAVLAARAAKPGHFRAKAILAAQSGNVHAAKKFEAKRAVLKAAKVKAMAPPRAPMTQKPRAPIGPKAPVTPKPVVTKPTAPTTPKPVVVKPKPFRVKKSGQAKKAGPYRG